MISFGRITKVDCANSQPPADGRCSDPAFAFANPGICPPQSRLMVKPAVALVCALSSVQFRAYIMDSAGERDVTDETIFSTSDPSVALVGAISGNATGVQAGDVTIGASYKGKQAFATLAVMGENCCDDLSVSTFVLVDVSRSMSSTFGRSGTETWATRLDYAKTAARRYINETNILKDKIGLYTFNAIELSELSALSNDVTAVKTAVDQVIQTQQLTTFYDALKGTMDALRATGTGRRVLVLISDGEDTTQEYTADNNPLYLAQQWKNEGHLLVVLGVRASGKGYTLLNALATGGFFINAYPSGGMATTALTLLSGLKGYFCAGNCVPPGDVMVARGTLNYVDYTHWDVIGGYTDLQGNRFYDYLPGNGLYVDLVSGNNPDGVANPEMVTRDTFELRRDNDYRLKVRLAGNQILAGNVAKVRVKLYSDSFTHLDEVIVLPDYKQDFTDYNFTFRASHLDNVRISVQQIEGSGLPTPTFAQRAGVLMKCVRLENVTDVDILFQDTFDYENLSYLPPRCGTGTTKVPVEVVPPPNVPPPPPYILDEIPHYILGE